MTDLEIDDLRRRIDAGEAVTTDELLKGLAAIRQTRVNAPTTKAASKTAIPKINIDFAALMASKKNPTP